MKRWKSSTGREREGRMVEKPDTGDRQHVGKRWCMRKGGLDKEAGITE